MADEQRTRDVSLGCGTLILIALIVLIFSQGGTHDLELEVQGLRSEIGKLTTSVDTQTREIQVLREQLDALQESVGANREK